MIRKGSQVIYVPRHAAGDVNHPDCEKGFVTSLSPAGTVAFCRYFYNAKYGAHCGQLRTTANSEATPIEMLVERNHRMQSDINDLLRLIEKGALVR